MAAREASSELTLVNVMGRCYRQYRVRGAEVGRPEEKHQQLPQQHQPQHQNRQPPEQHRPLASASIQDGDAAFEDAEGLVLIPGGAHGPHRYELKMPVPEVFHRFIVGTRGATVKQLMTDTGAKILVPRAPQEQQQQPLQQQQQQRRVGGAPLSRTNQGRGSDAAGGDIVTISASSASAVRSAERRVQLVVNDARDKLDYTHFVSVPLSLDSSVDARLREMQERVFKDGACRAVRLVWLAGWLAGGGWGGRNKNEQVMAETVVWSATTGLSWCSLCSPRVPL
jgi:hypothetical protein